MSDSTLSSVLQLFPDSVFLPAFCTCVLQQDREGWGCSSTSTSSASGRQESAAAPDPAAVAHWTRVLAPAPAESGLAEQQRRNRARGLSVPDVEELLWRTLPAHDACVPTALEHAPPHQSGPVLLDGDTLNSPAATLALGHGDTRLLVNRLETHGPNTVECMDESFFVEGSDDKPLRVHVSRGDGATGQGTTPPPTHATAAPRPAPAQKGVVHITPDMCMSMRQSGTQGLPGAPAGMAAAAAAAAPINLDFAQPSATPLDLDAALPLAAPMPAPNTQGWLSSTRLTPHGAASPFTTKHAEECDLDDIDDL